MKNKSKKLSAKQLSKAAGGTLIEMNDVGSYLSNSNNLNVMQAAAKGNKNGITLYDNYGQLAHFSNNGQVDLIDDGSTSSTTNCNGGVCATASNRAKVNMSGVIAQKGYK